MSNKDISQRTGSVRVLVVGDSGVGKTSLVHFLVHGEPLRHPTKTIGCNTAVRMVELPEDPASPSAGAQVAPGGWHGVGKPSWASAAVPDPGGGQHGGGGAGAGEPGAPGSGCAGGRVFFVELWDVGALKMYSNLRPLFYNQINGVLFVHDLSVRKSLSGLSAWVGEVASHASFSAPDLNTAAMFGGGTSSLEEMLPVPLLVVGNKLDLVQAKLSAATGLRRAGSGLFAGVLDPLFSALGMPGRRCDGCAPLPTFTTRDAEVGGVQLLVRRRYYPQLEAPMPRGLSSTSLDAGRLDDGSSRGDGSGSQHQNSPWADMHAHLGAGGGHHVARPAHEDYDDYTDMDTAGDVRIGYRPGGASRGGDWAARAVTR
eukprot:jgi/Mesvir1/19924/Mv13192-RA.2